MLINDVFSFIIFNARSMVSRCDLKERIAILRKKLPSKSVDDKKIRPSFKISSRSFLLKLLASPLFGTYLKVVTESSGSPPVTKPSTFFISL